MQCLLRRLNYPTKQPVNQPTDKGSRPHLQALDVGAVPVIGQQRADGAWGVGQVIQRLKQGHLQVAQSEKVR